MWLGVEAGAWWPPREDVAPCPGAANLRYDFVFYLSANKGFLLDDFYFVPNGVSPPVALVEGNELTIVFPGSLIGNSERKRITLQVETFWSGGADCAPDRGVYQTPEPSLGDANCDGLVDSRDAVLVQQYFARLTGGTLCHGAADANGNGTVGSIDAALILQMEAGLLARLPASNDGGS